jgi:hypothetical protein
MPEQIKSTRTRSEIEKALRDAGIHPGTWARDAGIAKVQRAEADEKSGGFEWILSTEKPAVVWDWERWEFVEEILLADGMLIPANNQVVLLDSHSRNSVKDVLGHVRDFAEAVVGEYPARSGMVHFAGNVDSQDARAKVEGKHITDGSVGYQPMKSVWVPEGEELAIGGRIFKAGPSGLRVTYQWLLREFSITPIGADVLAKVRFLCGA